MNNRLLAAIAMTLVMTTPVLAQRPNDVKSHVESQKHGPQRPPHAQYPTSKSHVVTQWSKGQRLPSANRKSQYVVSDWRHRRLATPAYGSQWVRNGNNQYALTNRRGYISTVVNQNDYRDTHRWSQGERVPQHYRGGAYIVTDWQVRHLRRPNRGYHWVRVNNQYLLIAIVSGLILNLITDDQ